MILFVLLTAACSLTVFFRFRKTKKLGAVEYLLLAIAIISGSYHLIVSFKNYSDHSRIESRMRLVTESYLWDSLKSDIQNIESLVTKLKTINLKDTPDDFRQAFNDCLNSFQLGLDHFRAIGEVDTLYSYQMKATSKRLEDVQNKYDW